MNRLLKVENEYKLLKILQFLLLPATIIAGVLGVTFYFKSCVMSTKEKTAFLIMLGSLIAYIIVVSIYKNTKQRLYIILELEILKSLGLSEWKYYSADSSVRMKSKQSVDNYTDLKFFKENPTKLQEAYDSITQKQEYAKMLSDFLSQNEFKNITMYYFVEQKIKQSVYYASAYYIYVDYISPAGRSQSYKTITVPFSRVEELYEDKSILMSKSDYNKYLKEQTKEQLESKQHDLYERVNSIIDFANEKRTILRIKNDQDELDKQIYALFDRTVNSIKKIKTPDSEEWGVVEKFINTTKENVDEIVERNQRILDYYESDDFAKLKSTCDALMDSQKEFNEYINEKAQSISDLFGARVVRNETVVDDVYNYIRPYKKSITPFTAEVSAAVFSSAENSPLEYIVKNFYPDKVQYPTQIQKLQLLIEELETLRDAKEIIENYKKDYQQYIVDVPAYVLENDEDGFYSKLGFANISEEVLTVEYKFSYTSNGGMAQRTFTVPMTEETIVELIDLLQAKLTMTAFTKEQRNLMTSKLRQKIKERDDYTCRLCGNSTYKEPNLLLEIDHIIPVAKGGVTVEDNLQTLCWKCNRTKSSKILEETGE